MKLDIEIGTSISTLILLERNRRKVVAELYAAEGETNVIVAWKAGSWGNHGDPFRNKWVEWESLTREETGYRSASIFFEEFDRVTFLDEKDFRKWKIYFSSRTVQLEEYSSLSGQALEPLMVLRPRQVSNLFFDLLQKALQDRGFEVPADPGYEETFLGKRPWKRIDAFNSLSAPFDISSDAVIEDYALSAAYVVWRNKLDILLAWKLEELGLGIGLAPRGYDFSLTTQNSPNSIEPEAYRSGNEQGHRSMPKAFAVESETEIRRLFVSIFSKSTHKPSSIRRKYRVDKESDNRNHLNAFTLAILERSGFYLGLEKYLSESHQVLFIAPFEERIL